jgi:hypothetical protein
MYLNQMGFRTTNIWMFLSTTAVKAHLHPSRSLLCPLDQTFMSAFSSKVWFSHGYGLNVLPSANVHNGHKQLKILKLFRYIFSSGILTLWQFHSEYIYDTNCITSNYLNVQLKTTEMWVPEKMLLLWWM